jgi:aldehyde dehydrogenase (NAD+)
MDVSKIRFVKQLFINGRFVDSIKKQTFDVINPNDETVLATIQKAGKEDVDAAVDAARTAFDKGPWTRMDAADRARCLFRLADLVEKHRDDLATVEAINNGKPAHIAKVADLELAHRCYRYYGGWADNKIKGHTSPIEGNFKLYTRR